MLLQRQQAGVAHLHHMVIAAGGKQPSSAEFQVHDVALVGIHFLQYPHNP